jgi:hypothetical protein
MPDYRITLRKYIYIQQAFKQNLTQLYVLFRKLLKRVQQSMLLQNRHVVPRLIYLDSLHFHPQVIIFQCVNKYKSLILTPL